MSQLYIALDQKYLTPDEFTTLRRLADEVHATVGGFIKYLSSPPKAKSPPPDQATNGSREPRHRAIKN